MMSSPVVGLRRIVAGCAMSFSLAASLTLTASSAQAQGPFGLSMGTTMSQLEKLGVTPSPDYPGTYRLARVPNPHPGFESYSVIYTPKFGVCKITAIGKDIESGGSGYEVASAFKAMAEALTNKYGTPTAEHNFLTSGSIWNESNDWMMGLLKKERILTDFWLVESGHAPMPDHITAIELKAAGLRSNVAYLVLNCEFENGNACIDEVRAKRNSVL